MKIIIDSAIPFIKGVLEPFAEVVYVAGDSFTPQIVADADGLIVRTRTRCNRELLEGSKVEFIATATIGFDHIDMEYCKSQGIKVTTAAGCNARGVLQWVAAVLVALSKREGFEPHERTLGIVGVGNVGKLVKHYAESWGFKVLCCDPPRQEREELDFLQLEQLLPQVDILTLHTPLDSTTRGMIDSKMLSLLHDDAVVINASRGEVVCSSALLERNITCALDVWENEPHIDPEHLAKSAVATPHVAGYSAQGKANASAMAIQALARHFDLPLTEWRPEEVESVEPRLISWEEMLSTIAQYCDLHTESEPLHRTPEEFESLRNNYHYRKEYF